MVLFYIVSLLAKTTAIISSVMKIVIKKEVLSEGVGWVILDHVISVIE